MGYTIIRGRLISVDDAEFVRYKEHAEQQMWLLTRTNSFQRQRRTRVFNIICVEVQVTVTYQSLQMTQVIEIKWYKNHKQIYNKYNEERPLQTLLELFTISIQQHVCLCNTYIKRCQFAKVINVDKFSLFYQIHFKRLPKFFNLRDQTFCGQRPRHSSGRQAVITPLAASNKHITRSPRAGPLIRRCRIHTAAWCEPRKRFISNQE